MKILGMTLLSLMVWNTTYALPFLTNPFCDKVIETLKTQQKDDQYEQCFYMAADFPKYAGSSLTFICMDTNIRIHNPIEAKKYCESETAKLDKVDTSKEEMAVEKVYTQVAPGSMSEHVPTETIISSKELDQCQSKDFLSKYNECNLANIPQIMSLESISDILNHPIIGGRSVLMASAPVYGESDCKCLEQKVKQDYKFMGQGVFSQEMQKERNRINGLIFNAVGKKFLNSYASNMEDVRYYLTNKVKALGTSPEEASNLQCNNARAFQSVIETECAANKVPKEIYEKRTKDLLSSFGDDMSDPTLDGKIKRIDEFILNITPDKKSMDVGPQRMFTRTEYDMIRNGASKKAPEIGFMNTLLNGVLNHPTLKTQFESNLKEGLNPGHALSRIMNEEYSPDVQNLLQQLISENKNQPLYKRLQGTLKTDTTDDYPDFIRNTYKIAVGAHPGLKALLTDRNLFNELLVKRQNSYDNKRTNFIDLLEHDPKLLNKHFSTRCEKLRQNLAQAVCTPDEDHVKRVKRDDINKLMTQIIGKSNLPLKDLLLCQMPDSQPKGIFNKLSFGFNDWLNRSDYFNRKLNPISQQDNGFSGAYRALNGNNGRGQVSEIVSALTSFSREKRESAPEIASEISRRENFTIPQQTKPGATPEINHFSKNIAEAVSTPSETPRIPESFASASSVVPLAVATPLATSESKTMRSQLKDYLSDKENEKTVDKLLSNAQDEDVKELLRLKDELAQDNEKIINLMRENDRSKLKSLEESYQALEKQYQEALKNKSAPTTSSVATTAETEEDLRDYSRGSTTGTYNTGGTEGVYNGSRFSDSTPSHTSSTGGVSAGRAVASTSSAGRNTSQAVASTPRESSRGDIIVETNSIHSADQQTDSQEINQEIISFVNKHETDVSTLQKLKDQGFILKFKVLQNGVEIEKEMKVEYSAMSPEAKQILDKKIAHQNIRSDQFGKLEHDYLKARRAYSYSALKMILGIQAQKTK
ncbi:hypothetical protein ACJVC5_12885 [Peredibacter sp. HCB2-198]|uniref:hypothetical protein n=1 Tax=Peredibacter sp. HCB2-198 TaxID=3383025 RepID=UPI0038B5D760